MTARPHRARGAGRGARHSSRAGCLATARAPPGAALKLRVSSDVGVRLSTEGMDRFVSTFTNKIDAKGRVSMPAPFRAVLERDGYKQGGSGGIYCYPSLEAPALDAGGERLAQKIDGLLAACRTIRTSGTSCLSRSMVTSRSSSSIRTDASCFLNRCARTPAFQRHITFVGLGEKFQMWEPGALRRAPAQARAKVQQHRRFSARGAGVLGGRAAAKERGNDDGARRQTGGRRPRAAASHSRAAFSSAGALATRGRRAPSSTRHSAPAAIAARCSRPARPRARASTAIRARIAAGAAAGSREFRGAPRRLSTAVRRARCRGRGAPARGRWRRARRRRVVHAARRARARVLVPGTTVRSTCACRRRGRKRGGLRQHAREEEIADILFHLGEERRSRAIARAIVAAARGDSRSTTHRELAELVARVLGRAARRRTAIRPRARSRRCASTSTTSWASWRALCRPPSAFCGPAGGSLWFVPLAGGPHREAVPRRAAGKQPADSRHLPPQSDQIRTPPSFRIINQRPLTPSQEEIAANPRARSARLQGRRAHRGAGLAARGSPGAWRSRSPSAATRTR